MRAHLAIALVGLLLPAGACGSEPAAEPETALCDPGENIFCRCPGGDPGTKQCNEAGDGFGSCDFCEARGGGDGDGDGDGDGPSTGPGGTGDLALLRPCTSSADCASGLCESNYCTTPCEKVSDCEFPVAECVPWGEGAVCMPACTTASDCEVYGAPPSLCGFAPAIDNWTVTVCSNWGDLHQLIPEATDCPPLDHEACNLGFAGRERVCSEQGVCETGCFKESDCPADQDCSSPGDTVGECG